MDQDYTPADGERVSLKRTALRAFIGSIVVSALLGIWALVAGEFGQLAVKVLLSSLCISAGSLCAMGAALLESRGARLPSLPAIGLSCATVVLLLVGIWGEVEGKNFWKMVLTLGSFAVASAHVSLLLLARLAPRFAWMRVATWSLTILLALYGTSLVWAEADGEGYGRILGVLSILVTAVTLATPVLHRLSQDVPVVGASGAGRVPMLCPSCGARCDQPLGDAECPRCGTRFRVVLAP